MRETEKRENQDATGIGKSIEVDINTKYEN